MDLIGSLFIFLALAVASYSFAKRKRLEQESQQNNSGSNKNQLNLLKDELERRTKIINRVDTFIRGSKLIQPIAILKNENIYKYIFNNGYLYEFDEILPDNNQRIGIDDDYLCFKQFCYKRVNNPTDFMNQFGSFLS